MILSTLKDSISELENMEVGEFLTMLFGILIGLAIVAWLFYAWAAKRRRDTDAACTLREEHVEVVSCTMLQTNMSAQWSTMKVVFETARGERVFFNVPGNENYVVGDRGVLRWQGMTIRSFTRDGVKSATEMSNSAQSQKKTFPAYSVGPKEEVFVKAENGRVKCPKCGLVQGASRRCCFECGARFNTEV